jgi:antitoxin ParD1/3/4
MLVSLTPELQDLIRDKLQRGQFKSESDVVSEALRLMGERDRFEAWEKDEVRQAIAAGVASIRAGHLVDGEAVFERLNRDLDDSA